MSDCYDDGDPKSEEFDGLDVCAICLSGPGHRFDCPERGVSR